MKRIYFFFIGILAMPMLNAQGLDDALRLSQDNIQGTARYRALSGAFGALGGDMSAVSLNPAGSAIFNSTHASASVSSLNKRNNTTYAIGNALRTTDNDFDLHQAGSAFVFTNRNENSPWKKFTFAVAYDKIGNFDNEWQALGTNTTSIASYFLNNANGLRLDQISAFNGETDTQAYAEIGNSFGYQNQQAFLGYQSYLIESELGTDESTNYFANIAGNSFSQAYNYFSSGYNGKFTFNVATQYKDNLYLGINLNSHFTNYERRTQLLERNNETGAVINNVFFENTLRTTGTGFSAQVGGILKVTQDLRVGVTYNTPTWFRIEDETTQYLETSSIDGIPLEDGSTFFSTVINPQIVNIFPQYRLRTPGKLSGSLAYVFGKQGLLSFDYSTKDYSNTELRSRTSGISYADVNQTISNTLKRANTYRVGGEFKLKQLSLRAGYRFEESPYKDTTILGDLNGYSVGLGYNFGNTKLDLTFDQSQQEYGNPLYNTGLTTRPNIDAKNSNITMSLSFNL